jgi:DNA-binding transcriptional LysR family regulator
MRALDALRDERNVTRAAQRLSRTQPAVSAMLTRLRESFGDPLFVRSQRGIVPTERALQLAAHLKQVLSEIEQMLQPRAFEPGEAEMTLTLASTDCALRAVVVPFLARLQAQLESGDVDMALIAPNTTAADLRTRRLFDECNVCVMRADHPAVRSSPRGSPRRSHGTRACTAHPGIHGCGRCCSRRARDWRARRRGDVVTYRRPCPPIRQRA